MEAVGDFDKALELDPDSAEALYNRGLAYSQGGVYDKALADYTQALKPPPRTGRSITTGATPTWIWARLEGGPGGLQPGPEAPPQEPGYPP